MRDINGSCHAIGTTAGRRPARPMGGRCIRISVADTESPLSRLARSWPSAGAGAPSIAGSLGRRGRSSTTSKIPSASTSRPTDSTASADLLQRRGTDQSTGGTFVDDALTLTFDHYATRVEARVIEDGSKASTVRGPRRALSVPRQQCGASATGAAQKRRDRRPLDHPGEELKGRRRRGGSSCTRPGASVGRRSCASTATPAR